MNSLISKRIVTPIALKFDNDLIFIKHPIYENTEELVSFLH